MSGSDFDELVEQYERYLARVEPLSVGEARARLMAWLHDGVPDLRVRVVLTSPSPTRQAQTS